MSSNPTNSPLTYLGVKAANPPSLWYRDRDPTTNDYRNYEIGDEWQNTVTKVWFKLASLPRNSGIWQQITNSTASGIMEVMANVNAAFPTMGGLINIVGDATTILATGDGVNTETFSLVTPVTVPHGGTGSTSLTGVLTGNGTSAISGTPVTQNSMLYGGAANTIHNAGVASNGQLLIGSTASSPALSTLTAGAGISVSNGAGSITISSTSPLTVPVSIASGGTNATSFTQTNGIVVYNGTSLVNYAGPQLSSAGVYKNSTQPAFFAYLPTSDFNVSGTGQFYTLGSGNPLIVNQQGGTNLSTAGVFTAPVTGFYDFSGTMYLANLANNDTDSYIYFNVSGNIYILQRGKFFTITSALTPNQAAFTVSKKLFVTMGQTVQFGFYDSGMLQQVAVYGASSLTTGYFASTFEGCLLD